MKKTVLAFSRITPPMIERLQQEFDVIVPNPKTGDINAQFNEALPHAHGLIGVGRKLGQAQLETASKLEVVSSVSVGYDNYDLAYFNERGIMLTNTPDVLTESTADLAFALIMSSARRVAELDAWTKAGQWQASVGAPLFGCDVHGKTLGIVGMGNIGAAVARRGRFGFNMPIIYSGNSRKPALEQELGAQFCSLDQLLAEADFVCLVVPLSAKTKHLIGAEQFKQMKRSAFLINISRGPVVDEAALAAIGRLDEAREMFEMLLERRNHLGLLSEDLAFDNGEAWGNFPQTYSMVGVINAAVRLSAPWDSVI